MKRVEKTQNIGYTIKNDEKSGRYYMKIKSFRDDSQKQILVFFTFTILSCLVIAFMMNTPKELLEGLWNIVISRDALVTDYFEIANIGAAFLNCALLMIMSLGLIVFSKLPFTGLTIGAFFISGGFALFGKNPINIVPILFGSFLYAKMQGVKMARYLYIALFATALAPLVTELAYILPFAQWANIIVAILVGIIVGFVIPPLSAHTVSMHMGYNLFNVGFATGILGFVIVCILKSYGIQIENVMIWKEGRPLWLIVVLYLYFVLTFLYGWILCQGSWQSVCHIMRHPGRAVADFILMDGVGPTFMNMGIVGSVCLSYIIMIGGDLAGPIVGAILSIFGFAAFGVHVRNYLPVLLGIYLATFIKIFTPTTPGTQIASLFSACVAPICGQFGMLAGIAAGYLHICIVTFSGQMYSGLNLYNNGFAGGFVAIIMIPVLESFIKRFKER